MYNTIKPTANLIKVNTAYQGETIENKVRRIEKQKEPIKDGAPLIYQERKDGVNPSYNIKTDRWDYAIDAMDKVAKTHKAKRDEKNTIGEQAKAGMKAEEGGKDDTK